MGFGVATRSNDDDDSFHSLSSSLASSGTTPPASRSGSTRTSSSISSLDGGASDDGNGGGVRPGQSPAHPPGYTLEAPSRKHRSGGRHSSRPARLFQRLRSALPILAPRCGRTPGRSAGEIAAAAALTSSGADNHLLSRVVSFSGSGRHCRRVTGTLFGHRKGRVALALQETPRCLPSLVIELALQTHALLRELSNPAGARIVLETERRVEAGGEASKSRRAPPLLDEAAWTMFCNGRKTGYAVRREATSDDLTVMETLRAVSMGAGVLPGGGPSSPAEASTSGDEVAYMRGCFDHFVGSRDSESLYMLAPHAGGTGPELAVFFVRL